MRDEWKDWVHITKLDPDRVLPEEYVEDIVTSGTDALMLSGTLNVTQENLHDLLEQVDSYGLPLVVEPADPSGVLFEGVQGLFVPSVMNTDDVRWLIGKHKSWVKHSAVNWDMVVPEAYIVLNPESSVGKVTGADCTISAEDVAAYATVADKYYRFPVVYVEYSGTYGDPLKVKAAADALDEAILYYGGGINSPERAAEMGAIADVIVIGNAVYDKGPQFLKTTVRAVH